MMKNDYSQKEEKCIQCFSRVKPCYHLWTPENFEIIFRNDAEFRFGMGIKGLKLLDGVFSPFSFCDIETGESLFRDAVHYFYMLSKNIECNKEIAKEIGESVSYTEEELYAAICIRCKQKYGTANPSQIPANAKVDIAKTMRYEYNASHKQIQRMLRLDSGVLHSIFGK